MSQGRLAGCGGVDGGGEEGVGGGDDGVGEPLTPPVQATPLSAKLAGAGLSPVQEPLKPNETVPLVTT